MFTKSNFSQIFIYNVRYITNFNYISFYIKALFICDIKTSRTDVINHLIHIWGLSAKANEKVFSPTIYRADEYSQLQKALDEEFN